MTNTSEYIHVEEADRILTIRMDRPEKKNALTQDMYGAIKAALTQAEEDSNIRVAMITGSESCFTAGNDLGDFLHASSFRPDNPVVDFLHVLRTFNKPLVAAVNGVAVGVGTTMLLHCDLVYAGENARFMLPFVNLGLVPEAGSTLLLPQLVGHVRAAELLMLAEPLDAEKALALGLINGVYPPSETEQVAREKALALASKAPMALRLTKLLLKRAQRDALAETMAIELEHFSNQLQGPEAAEALQAFMERREPDFSRF